MEKVKKEENTKEIRKTTKVENIVLFSSLIIFNIIGWIYPEMVVVDANGDPKEHYSLASRGLVFLFSSILGYAVALLLTVYNPFIKNNN